MDWLSMSQECLSHIDSLDRDYESQFPSKHDREMTTVFRELTKRILESREGFAGEALAVIEEIVKNAEGFVSGQLDDLFTRLLLEEVPEMAARVIRLSRLDAPLRPSKDTSIYIREAARTYIYGLPQASVAISRAALEQALKESLGRQGSGEFITFQELVDDAKKWDVIDAPMARAIRETARKADCVLHERPTNHEGAFQVLTEVRGYLQQIYSVGGGA